MLPFISELSLWYKTDYPKDTTTQFIFYNNDEPRKPGTPGPIYCQTKKGYPELLKLVERVYSHACFSDVNKRHMNELITGVKLANSYKEIILLVDKDAPLQDFDNLKKINQPVHIILCVTNRTVNPQHLQIAWRTKGSFHTSAEDIYDIGKLVEGDTIVVAGIKYKIRGGEFIQI